MKKGLFLGIIALVVLTSGLIVSADSIVKLFVDGQELESDIRIEDSRTIGPVRDIAEALGATVGWDAETESVIIDSENDKAKDMQITRLHQALIPQDTLSAATTWAEGTKIRNGALQYAIMSPDLKEQKYSEYVEMGWSTGTSSPWVKEYTVTEKGKLQEGVYVYQIEYIYTDSTQSVTNVYENITVGKFDMGWSVNSIDIVDAAGQITEVYLNDDRSIKSIFVEGSDSGIGNYDKADVIIGDKTQIYKGYTNEELNSEDLEEGLNVIVTFVEGPRIMIYPPSAQGKVIRVLD